MDPVQQPVDSPAPKPAYVPPEVIDGVRILHATVAPPKSKPWGCRGCKLFQYAPCFTKKDRENYKATLDADRHEKKNRSYQLDGVGPEDARVMVVLDSPSADEDQQGKTAIGGGVRVVSRNSREAGLDPSRWFWTYAVKCRGPAAPDLSTGIYCSKFLSQDIQRVKPHVILAAGSLPTALLLGKPGATIRQYHCVPQNVVVAGHACTVYPMWSPSYVRKNDFLEGQYTEAFVKFARFLSGEEAVAEDKSIYELVNTPDDAIALCKRLMQYDRLAVDLETSGLSPYDLKRELPDGTLVDDPARVSVISLSASRKKGYAIPYNHDDVPWSEADRRRFLDEGYIPLLQRPGMRLDWHNGKFDYKWHYEKLGFAPIDINEDTMLSHYASDENEEHGLKPLSLRWTDMGDYDKELDRYLSTHFPKDSPRYDLTPWPLVGKYAGMDTVACNKLKKSVRANIQLQDASVHALAYRVLPAYSAALTRMEHVGCHIDVPFTQKILPVVADMARKSFDAILSEPIVRGFIRDKEASKRAEMKRPRPIEEKRYFEFKLGSPQQLSELLFDPKYYGHDVVEYTESGGASTDKETMNALVEQGSPIAKRIVEYRLDHSLENTYVRPSLRRCEMQALPRLHPSLLIHGTKTGRLACKEPNLQNIPNKGAGLIKRMFTSRYGSEGCIIQADYSQVELRILACIANDKGMIEAFVRGDDLHELTAAMIFDMTVEEFRELKASDEKKAKDYRTIAKRINFGIPYGVGGPGISGMLKGEGIDIDVDTCTGYIDKFFREKPQVKRWIDRVMASTVDEAISRSLYGRRRRLEQVRSRMHDVIARAQRQAVNHPIQSTGGDMTLTSLTLMDQEIQARIGTPRHLVYPTIDWREFPVTEGWDKVHPMLTVHDSNVFDCHRSMASAVVDMCQRTMTNVVDLSPLLWGDDVESGIACLRKVPMKVDVEVGPSYRDGVSCKSPKDAKRALFIGDRKMAFLDLDHKAKWTEKMAEEISAEYEKAAA